MDSDLVTFFNETFLVISSTNDCGSVKIFNRSITEVHFFKQKWDDTKFSNQYYTKMTLNDTWHIFDINSID